MSWGTASPITISSRVQGGATRLTGRVSFLSPPPLLLPFVFSAVSTVSRTQAMLLLKARGSAHGVLQSRAEVFKQEAKSDLTQAWGWRVH